MQTLRLTAGGGAGFSGACGLPVIQQHLSLLCFVTHPVGVSDSLISVFSIQNSPPPRLRWLLVLRSSPEAK